MITKREFSAEYLNQIANDPSVSYGAKLTGIADLSSLVADLRNVIITFNGGALLGLYKGDFTYEVHTMASKDGRGPILREAIKEALEYMFIQTACDRLITTAYKDNKAAVVLSEHYFQRRGETEETFYYELSYQSWVEKSGLARDAGAAFHGAVETNLAEDAIHDAHVGGAMLLLKAGNPAKAIRMYNGWAVMSGYEQIFVLNALPLIASLGNMKLIYHNQKLEQIQCL